MAQNVVHSLNENFLTFSSFHGSSFFQKPQNFYRTNSNTKWGNREIFKKHNVDLLFSFFFRKGSFEANDARLWAKITKRRASANNLFVTTFLGNTCKSEPNKHLVCRIQDRRTCRIQTYFLSFDCHTNEQEKKKWRFPLVKSLMVFCLYFQKLKN